MVLRARAAARVKGCGVLLVDDIRTTGATMEEARRLLEGAGAAWVAPTVACGAEIASIPFTKAFAASLRRPEPR